MFTPEAFANIIGFNPRSGAGSDKLINFTVNEQEVSIHAPARGATSPAVDIQEVISVSIHAPARGATPLTKPLLDSGKFQSTLPRGERPTRTRRKGSHFMFQSTLPRGERRPGFQRARRLHSFNPRSRAGSDAEPAQHKQPPNSFQSTLPRGERPRRGLSNHTVDMVSIHAPARGATAAYNYYLLTINVSIHAPARGATPHS